MLHLLNSISNFFNDTNYCANTQFDLKLFKLNKIGEIFIGKVTVTKCRATLQYKLEKIKK